MGYSIIYANRNANDERSKGDRTIVINETGKKFCKAFEWKAKGMKNEEILECLKAMGVKINKQKISMIFTNPFYCRIITTKMQDSKLVEAQHEKLISKEFFLKVNDVRAEAKVKYGILHNKEQKHVPLKVFMKCDECNKGYSGYIVKSEYLWYYKCRTTGCCNSKNANLVNVDFKSFPENYSIQPLLIQPLINTMKQ